MVRKQRPRCIKAFVRVVVSVVLSQILVVDVHESSSRESDEDTLSHALGVDLVVRINPAMVLAETTAPAAALLLLLLLLLLCSSWFA